MTLAVPLLLPGMCVAVPELFAGHAEEGGPCGGEVIGGRGCTMVGLEAWILALLLPLLLAGPPVPRMGKVLQLAGPALAGGVGVV